MRRNIIIILNLLSLMIICDAMNMGESLMLFFVAGIIPGTHVSISPLVMLAVFVILSAMMLFYFATTFEVKTAAKRSLPKKRYSRV